MMLISNFFIATFGCKVNIYESESIANLLIKNNFHCCSSYNYADIVIVNSCSVTSKGERKCRNFINRVYKLNKKAIIVLCGCNVDTLDEEVLYKTYKDVSIFLKNKNKDKILEAINNYIDNKYLNNRHISSSKEDKLFFVSDMDGCFNLSIDNFLEHSRAFVKIQDGCNNFCSYCIIPYSRGNIRSRNYKDVIIEISSLYNNGFREMVLTGINIGTYKFDDLSFSDLLEILVNQFKDIRFRISSIEPQYIDDKFLTLLKENNNICNHLHIPLQNGSARILKLMNRHYSRDDYYKKIENIRKIREDIFLSTDLILGFPSESDIDFNETLSFINDVKFSFINLFGYSPRSGTKAIDIIPKVPERIRDERIEIVNSIVEEGNLRYRNRFVGKNLEVIIEKRKNDFYTAKSDNYIDFIIDTKEILEEKKIYTIKFDRIDNDINYGKLII